VKRFKAKGACKSPKGAKRAYADKFAPLAGDRNQRFGHPANLRVARE
jgi:hypothetical protein